MDLKYNEFLDRIHDKLEEIDPKLIEDSARARLSLPNLKVEHAKDKTVVKNFFVLCKKITYNPMPTRLKEITNKLKQFILEGKMATDKEKKSTSLNESNGLVIAHEKGAKINEENLKKCIRNFVE